MSRRLRSDNAPKISFFAFQDIITAVCGILILVTLILATNMGEGTTTDPTAPDGLQHRLNGRILDLTRINQQVEQLQRVLAEAASVPDARKIEGDLAELQSLLEVEQKRADQSAREAARREREIREQDARLGLTSLRTEMEALRRQVAHLAHQAEEANQRAAQLQEQIKNTEQKLLRSQARANEIWLIPEPSSTSKEPVLVVVSGQGISIDRFDHPEQRLSYGATQATKGMQQFMAGAGKLNQYFVFYVRPSGITLFEQLAALARKGGFEVGYDALEEARHVNFSRPPS